jgi:hypothetical protein
LLKLNEDIEELVSRYKPMVRDVLIVVSNPDTPENLLSAMSDELQFGMIVKIAETLRVATTR